MDSKRTNNSAIIAMQALDYFSKDIRKKLEAEWGKRACNNLVIKDKLTSKMSEIIFGMDTTSYKKYKNLPESAALRDNMSRKELGFLMLGELCATHALEASSAKDYQQIEKISLQAANVAGDARKEFEKVAKINVLTPNNHQKH